MPNRLRNGITSIQVITLLAIGSVAITLLAPALVSLREASRRSACSNRLRQHVNACLNYESAFKQFPAGWGGPAQLVQTSSKSQYVGDPGVHGKLPPIGRWSPWISLLPYLDEQPELSGQIQDSYYHVASKRTFVSPMAPWDFANGDFMPWRTQLACLRCPSDPACMDEQWTNETESCGRTNYGFCYGDTGIHSTEANHEHANRGMFQGRNGRRLRDITDGTAYTIGLAEIATPEKRRVGQSSHYDKSSHGQVLLDQVTDEIQPWQCNTIQRSDREANSRATAKVARWRGIRWQDGAPVYSGFNTILPPNAPSCLSGSEEMDWGYLTASSYHVSGAHVAFMDGDIRFVPNTIDTGDLTRLPPEGNEGRDSNKPSWFGAWGAMGTIDAGDSWDASRPD